MKICPLGSEMFHADGRRDGRTDMKLIACYRNFAGCSKNVLRQLIVHLISCVHFCDSTQ